MPKQDNNSLSNSVEKEKKHEVETNIFEKQELLKKAEVIRENEKDTGKP